MTVSELSREIVQEYMALSGRPLMSPAEYLQFRQEAVTEIQSGLVTANTIPPINTVAPVLPQAPAQLVQAPVSGPSPIPVPVPATPRPAEAFVQALPVTASPEQVQNSAQAQGMASDQITVPDDAFFSIISKIST
jgi:hypothetical protein